MRRQEHHVLRPMPFLTDVMIVLIINQRLLHRLSIVGIPNGVYSWFYDGGGIFLTRPGHGIARKVSCTLFLFFVR